jgi:FtsH-binding integral membrane protein
MNMNHTNNQINYTETSGVVSVSKTFLSGVFMWMTMALSITALVSWTFASNPSLMSILINSETGSMSALGWVVMFAPLGLVLLMGMRFQKMSASSMLLVFIVYSILMGMSLSFIFLVYSLPSIAKTFVITAGMFGFMAIVGYTTKTDLTKFGKIMMMGLVGIIIASVVNFFTQSARMDYVISFIGVMVFTGLTAYDVQKLKRLGAGIGTESEMARKATIFGALTLYLDFINLFLFLLRFFGDRK